MTCVLTDDGRWFDRDKATRFAEDERWDGSNMVSVATGSQWDHEELFRTRMGNWVLHSWSQWQGTRHHYEFVSEAVATKWLLRSGYEVGTSASAALES